MAKVELLGGFEVQLTFTDGAVRRLDLEPYLRGPVFDPIRRDPALFRAVRIDPELGVLCWPNGADLDAEVLRWGLRPAAWDGPDRP